MTIANDGPDTVQLLSRHWIITDGAGHVEEVRGPGVVGKQPTLAPGESFEYTSGSRSDAVRSDGGHLPDGDIRGEEFDAKIAPFTLGEPYTVH